MDDWWKHTTIYQVYPRSFKDSNGDGVGDLRGIIEQLDYLQDLAVETLWICPFYRSPQRDFGCDITDHEQIAPEFGTIADLHALVEALHSRGMKVVFDLVLNHTSDEHPWFVASRSDRTNAMRHFYLWRDGRKPAGRAPPNNWRSALGGSGWHYDARTEQWYFASFLPLARRARRTSTHAKNVTDLRRSDQQADARAGPTRDTAQRDRSALSREVQLARVAPLTALTVAPACIAGPRTEHRGGGDLDMTSTEHAAIRTLVGGVALVALVAQGARAQDATYPIACGSLIEVGTTNGRPTLVDAFVINDRGLIGGADNMGLAAIWDPKTNVRKTLGSLDGSPGRDSNGYLPNTTEVVDLNDRGEATGNAPGFYWSEATGMLPLGGLSRDDTGATHAQAAAISAFGQVVGQSRAPDGLLHPFSWTRRGGMVDLGLLPGCTRGTATDVNELGIVVGEMICPNADGDHAHGFVWSRYTGLHDLGSFGGGETRPAAVDVFGRVVGTSRDAQGVLHMFRWHPLTGFRDLGSYGDELVVADSNDLGAIVGSYGHGHPFVYSTREGFRDLGLEDLIDSDLPPIGAAYSINLQGTIVGWYATYPKSTPPFVWQPCGR